MRSESVKEACQLLREKLESSIRSLSYDGMTLSGGLDTSIVAYVASKESKNLESVSVGFEESPMEDLIYAKLVADELGLENHVHIFDFNEAKRAMKKAIRITESFDPMEIRNSAAIYISMERARELGMEEVLTGDGSDELFAGYSFLYEREISELDSEIRKISKTMTFSSRPIADSLGIKAKLPFLQDEFREFAMEMDPGLKVGKKNGKKIGKWMLRRTYEDRLPNEIIWRKKTPIESGTGTTVFPDKFESLIGDVEFSAKKETIKEEDGVRIRSKEQLYYYDIYRSTFGPPEPEDSERRTCPYCGTNVRTDATFCRTCGNSIGEENEL